jgi:hypothetical protein
MANILNSVNPRPERAAYSSPRQRPVMFGRFLNKVMFYGETQEK